MCAPCWSAALLLAYLPDPPLCCCWRGRKRSLPGLTHEMPHRQHITTLHPPACTCCLRLTAYRQAGVHCTFHAILFAMANTLLLCRRSCTPRTSSLRASAAGGLHCWHRPERHRPTQCRAASPPRAPLAPSCGSVGSHSTACRLRCVAATAMRQLARWPTMQHTGHPGCRILQVVSVCNLPASPARARCSFVLMSDVKIQAVATTGC